MDGIVNKAFALYVAPTALRHLRSLVNYLVHGLNATWTISLCT